MGYYLETGEVTLTLAGGFKVVIPPEQHHCLGQVNSESKNVGPCVDSPLENVGPFVDTAVHPAEIGGEQVCENNNDIQQQNPAPIHPQELLNQLQQSENPQDILKTTQQALTWIIAHLLNNPMNQAST
jgi:hypothetical protein